MKAKKWNTVKNICMAFVAVAAVVLALGGFIGEGLPSRVVNLLLVLEMIALGVWMFASMQVVAAKTVKKSDDPSDRNRKS